MVAVREPPEVVYSFTDMATLALFVPEADPTVATAVLLEASVHEVLLVIPNVWLLACGPMTVSFRFISNIVPLSCETVNSFENPVKLPVPFTVTFAVRAPPSFLATV